MLTVPSYTRSMPQAAKPGYEIIPLDLARVPTVDAGLADAAARYRQFSTCAADALGSGEDRVLLKGHLPFLSLVNRASSLHTGVVSAVRESNPHAVFTLLRAYLELVVLVYYLDVYPDYVKALERPMSELPKGTRKRFSELFEFASGEMPGVRAVYDLLSEMAHFGSTALWHPFTVDDEAPPEGSLGTLRYYSGPSWRRPDDARLALAMLLEADEATFAVLDRYLRHHVKPAVDAHRARELAASWTEIPPAIASAAVAEGWLTACQEHNALELAEGIDPSAFDAWLRERRAIRHRV